MLAIYDEEISVIELDGIDIESVYQNILSNPDYAIMKFLFTKNGKVIGAGALGDFLDNTVIPKTFELESDFFAEARKYCIENKVRYNTFFPVLNQHGECVWLLFYMENLVLDHSWKKGIHCEEFKYYDLLAEIQELDFTLLEDSETYIFLELEEYTHAIAQLILKKWPEKQVYFQDKKAMQVFGEKIEYFHSGIYKSLMGKKYLFITSDGKSHTRENVPECFQCRYSSLTVMESLLWNRKKEHLGNLNQGKTVFILDPRMGDNGLVDIMKYSYTYYLLAKERGWEVVVDYSRKPNQYLNAEGENMWEYFFEPFSPVTLEEANQSDRVIRASANELIIIGRLNPYWRYWNNTDDYARFMKEIRLNTETQATVDALIPPILQHGNSRVLGVVARGTDYRQENNERLSKNLNIVDVDKVIKKAQYMMDIWQCDYIFVATEDKEYFSMFQQVFGERMLSIEQPRVYHDYSMSDVPVSRLLNIKDGKEFGRRYLAVIASLAKCNVLLGNMMNGTWEAALSLNDGKYEWSELVASEGC